MELVLTGSTFKVVNNNRKDSIIAAFLDNIPDITDKRSAVKVQRSAKRRPKLPEPTVLVEYVRTKCPFCESYKVPVYDSKHLPVRYHKCGDCGGNFKSVEK